MTSTQSSLRNCRKDLGSISSKSFFHQPHQNSPRPEKRAMLGDSIDPKRRVSEAKSYTGAAIRPISNMADGEVPLF